jgi:succinate-acetate transporter protein
MTQTVLRARPRPIERPPARIVLSPIAAPSILGYFALASALFIYGSWLAGWWGTEKDTGAFFPFILLFGGFGQLAAALWGYRARAAVAAALHGSWAAFWLGIGLVYLLATTHAIAVPARGAVWQSLGEWSIYMAVITWTTAIAALARSPIGFVAQGLLGTGCAFAAAGFLNGSSAWEDLAGWFLVAAGAVAFAAGAFTMTTGAHDDPVQYERGDPGVKVGQ